MNDAAPQPDLATELAELAYAVSHDLRAPLRAVLHNLEFLERRSGEQLDERGRDHLTRALIATRQGHRMIDDLLLYSRLETQAGPHAPIELDDVLARVRRDLAEHIAERGASLTVQPLPRIIGERRQLELLFRHLLHNALLYGGDGVSITIGCRLEPPRCLIELRDNGPGFPGEEPARALRMFTSLHDANASQGNGMGLAIARRVAQLHGGTLRVDNLPERGAVARVSLPLPDKGDLANAPEPTLRIRR